MPLTQHLEHRLLTQVEYDRLEQGPRFARDSGVDSRPTPPDDLAPPAGGVFAPPNRTR
jgi:hypothetical protein